MGYSVQNSADKGKVLIAETDFLPGSEIFRENAILFVGRDCDSNKDFIANESATSIRRDLWAAYEEYKKLNDESRAEIVGLFGPITGSEPERYKKILSASKYKDNLNIEDFVKVVMVFKFNGMFCEENIKNEPKEKSGMAVYSNFSKLSHSCAPNCTSYFVTEGNSSRWRSVCAIVPIKKGDELTIAYNSEILLKPTHERRQYLLNSHYNFHCVCTRCQGSYCNGGDDTRQFDCCVSAGTASSEFGLCHGRHFILQPSENTFPYRQYLLPCSECKKSPSEETDDLKMDQERDLLHALKQLRYDTKIHNKVIVYDELTLLSPYHYSNIEILKKKIAHHMRLEHGEHCITLFHALLRCVDSFIQFPCDEVCDLLAYIGHNCLTIGTENALHLGKVLTQRALRNRMLLHGSEGVPYEHFTAVASILEKSSVFDVPAVNAAEGNRTSPTAASSTNVNAFQTNNNNSGSNNSNNNNGSNSTNSANTDTIIAALTAANLNQIKDKKSTKTHKRNESISSEPGSSSDSHKSTSLEEVEVVECCVLCERGVNEVRVVLRRCGQCKAVQYCNPKCQRAHWKLHKNVCKK